MQIRVVHGLGWVEIFQFLVGWVAVVLEIWSANSALSRLTNSSCIGLGRVWSKFSLVMSWVGSGHTKWTHGQL